MSLDGLHDLLQNSSLLLSFLPIPLVNSKLLKISPSFFDDNSQFTRKRLSQHGFLTVLTLGKLTKPSIDPLSMRLN